MPVPLSRRSFLTALSSGADNMSKRLDGMRKSLDATDRLLATAAKG